MKKKYAISD